MERILTHIVSAKDIEYLQMHCNDGLAKVNNRNDQGSRLTVKQVLKSLLFFSARQISQAKFREQGICKNGVPCWVNEEVTVGDCIEIKLEDEEKASGHLIPYERAVSVLYEDDDLIIVNKPAGVPVHPSHGHYTDTLANMLAYYYGCREEHVCIRPVGRLDLETSGAVVFAKNQAAASRLGKQKDEGTFAKEYIAIVEGRFDVLEGEIKSPMRRVKDALNKMEIHPDGKPAWTEYQVLRTHRAGTTKLTESTRSTESTESAGLEESTGVDGTVKHEHEYYSVVCVKIHTGRTHQIRLHMASIGHPLLGDSRYNIRCEKSEQGVSGSIGRTALHAHTVELEQPFTGERIWVEAPLPEDMAMFWHKS